MTKRIRVFGIVQGVGFRPTVSRHASASGIRGTVCNCGPYVEIIAQGTQEQIENFLMLLRTKPPVRASIIRIDETGLPDTDVPEYAAFEIIESAKTKGAIFISPDIAICDDCKAELTDPHDRRYQHPFINCTCCGPRLTILDSLPYDRERTSMKEFPMCPECASEYTDPASRRYDAQPVCCNDCGPQVYLLESGRDGAQSGGSGSCEARAQRDVPGSNAVRMGVSGREAITQTRRVIAQGGIAAIKGIGGFHLCCDASSDAAVGLLRQRKTRPAKPFAVMMRDEQTVRRECEVSETAQQILTGHQKPILLLPKKPGGRLSELIAPDNPKVGVMLPYAPVQLLLFDYDDGIEMPDMLVMTSGNISGAPICRDDTEAAQELGHLCDVILSHDRKIRIRADDSVMDLYRGKPYMVRRSRGYAPLPCLVGGLKSESVLAVGGELKNTFCLSREDLFYPSSYIGDLADVRSTAALDETIGRYAELLETKVQLIACDDHPGYHSGELAREIAERTGAQVVTVQHHFAHIVSCLAENDFHGKVIGVSFDGTGYGTDGTIWGGELMIADMAGFTRIGSIHPFLHVGGDAASREGWRIAVSMIGSVFEAQQQDAQQWQTQQQDKQQQHTQPLDALQLCTLLDLCTPQEAKAVLALRSRRINTVVSTSCGRLFDAVSAVLGIRTHSTFEGEAAMALEAAAWRYRSRIDARGGSEAKTAALYDRTAAGTESMDDRTAAQNESRHEPLIKTEPAQEDGFIQLPTDRIFMALVQERLQGKDSDELAYAFHDALARSIVRACEMAAEKTGIRAAALSGGCFQNLLLLELVHKGLEDGGFKVLIHSLIPPNDGGIALGQAVAALSVPGNGAAEMTQ